MAWEWVGPISTAVVGVAGIAAAYVSGQRQVATALNVSDRQAETLLLAQREERHQRRLEAAYPPLLDVLAAGDAWAWQVDSFATGDSGRSEPPPMPDDVRRLSERGALTAVWSPQVSALVREWSIGAGSAMSAARRLSYCWRDHGVQKPSDRNSPGPDLTDVLEGRATHTDQLDGRFRANHERMRMAAVRLREQVWRELRAGTSDT